MDNLELTLLREFFKKWCALHALPTGPGRKSKEHMDAAQELVDAANAIKNLDLTSRTEPAQKPSEEAMALRALQTQVADLPPKDGFKVNGKHVA